MGFLLTVFSPTLIRESQTVFQMPLSLPNNCKIPDEWYSTLEKLRTTRTVFVLGLSDTGKTTFIKFLIKEFVESGSNVSFIDSDIGQSTVGIPTSISSVLLSSPQDLSSPEPASHYFIGYKSPPGNLLQMAAGVRRTADFAFESGCDLAVVDTTGFVKGGAANELKYQKIALLQPTHVIAIEMEEEMEPLLRLVSHSFPSTEVIRLSPVTAVKAKSPEERRKSRERKFMDYFSASTKIRLKFPELVLRRGYFGSGVPIPLQELYELSKMCGVDLLYGEEGVDEASFIVRAVRRKSSIIDPVKSYMSGKYIRILDRGDVKDGVVGLGTGGDFVEALGVIQEIRENEIEVISPIEEPDRIKLLTFGSLKISPTGRELGRVGY